MAYFHEKPVANVTIFNVNYDLAKEITDEISAPIYATVLINRGDDKACGNRNVVVVNTKESSITSTLGIEVGVSVLLKAGIPLLWKSETTISPKVSGMWSWGNKNVTTLRDAIQTNICVPPR